MMRRACIAALVIASQATHAAAQQPRFRSETAVVELDVSVMRGRVPVAGLTAADFELTDNGRRQTLISAVVNPQPIRVTLVLDVSSSVSGSRLENLVRAGRAVVDQMRPGETASLITFSHRARLRVPFGASIDEFRRALTNLTADGSTALRDAADLALSTESEQRTGSLILLFSDGLDTMSWLTEQQVIESARRSSSVIHAVRAGGDPILDKLSAVTSGRTWSIGSDRELTETFTRILDEMRARYVLTYSPREPPERGWHELKVSVKNVRADVTARPGYAVR